MMVVVACHGAVTSKNWSIVVVSDFVATAPQKCGPPQREIDLVRVHGELHPRRAEGG